MVQAVYLMRRDPYKPFAFLNSRTDICRQVASQKVPGQAHVPVPQRGIGPGI
jgi:hypothetical protein